MTIRSGLAGAAAATVVVAAFGNPVVVDAAGEADHAALAESLTAFASWDIPEGTPGDVIAGTVIRLVLAVVVTGLLSALAGRSRSRGAAAVGGWGALVVAAAIAGAAAQAYLVAVPLDGQVVRGTWLDGLVSAANAGASFGLWSGWAVGLAVALATRPGRAPRPAPAGTGAPPRRRIVEPPPPWWAPTTAGTGGPATGPGPAVFPPGGLSAGERGPAYEMTTTSGDPHPSDPDATRAVGMPGRDDTAVLPAPGDGSGGHDPDPDVTQATPPDDPGHHDADETRTMPTAEPDDTVDRRRPRG
jgi:hypothetical protein